MKCTDNEHALTPFNAKLKTLLGSDIGH